jgi:2-keto-3-deoxy-L-fuconate dehydrogenase
MDGKRLAGRRAVVTAAGQGIGNAIAEAFIREGATVHASDIKPELLEGLACATAALDVTSTPQVDAYAGLVGDVDVVVNVAGYVADSTALDATDEEWDKTFEINVKSMNRMIRAFLPGMIRRAAETGISASVVNMSSCASSLRGLPKRYLYGTTKAAVIGLTKAVAADFIRSGVRANAICAGPVRSPSWEARVEILAEKFGDRKKALDHYLSLQPIGRVGEPEEIAALAVYLASAESDFMTGTAIPLDGGLTL